MLRHSQKKLEKWKILPGNIGYVHMGILQIEDVDQMIQQDRTNCWKRPSILSKIFDYT
jgi:hypothetical protein